LSVLDRMNRNLAIREEIFFSYHQLLLVIGARLARVENIFITIKDVMLYVIKVFVFVVNNIFSENTEPLSRFRNG
jgi:hypothetical protein